MSKIVKVGVMPGQINEYGVEVGQSIKSVLEIAGLDASGYEVKVDGTTVSNTETATITASTSHILLTKQVKGNNIGGTPTQGTYGVREVKVGMMPGQIRAYAVNVGTSIKELLAIANLDSSGYDVKVDGVTVQDANATYVDGSTYNVLLTKQVKGN